MSDRAMVIGAVMMAVIGMEAIALRDIIGMEAIALRDMSLAIDGYRADLKTRVAAHEECLVSLCRVARVGEIAAAAPREHRVCTCVASSKDSACIVEMDANEVPHIHTTDGILPRSVKCLPDYDGAYSWSSP